MNGKILIIYAHDLGYPPRITNDDMLYCFERYSKCLCYYVNVAFGVPGYLKDNHNYSFPLLCFQFLENIFLSDRQQVINAIHNCFLQGNFLF